MQGSQEQKDLSLLNLTLFPYKFYELLYLPPTWRLLTCLQTKNGKLPFSAQNQERNSNPGTTNYPGALWIFLKRARHLGRLR